MATCVLNVFPIEWSSFATSVYSRKDTTPFNELWAQCIFNEKYQAFVVKSKKKKKGKIGKSKGKQDMSKIQCLRCNEYGHFKRDCPNMKKNERKARSRAHTTKEKEEPEKKPKGEDPKDHYS